jgi:hypothetical protein
VVPTELIDKYAWVNEIEAWTVSVVEGRRRDDVVRAFGGDPADPAGEFTFAGVDAQRGPQVDHLEFYVQLLTVGDHVVAIEHNGWSGSLPEIARRCSTDGGRFFSVYWNVNGFGMITQAIDSAVTACFEALYPFGATQNQGERRPDWAIGSEDDVDRAWQVDMALLEQQTGVAVDPAWLQTPLLTYSIPDPHWHYRDVVGAEHP